MKYFAVAAVAALLLVFTFSTPVSAQDTLMQKAAAAFNAAQDLEAELNEKPIAERPRSAYLRVIEAYERVYLTTPHTGYADNALMTIARLYEELRDSRAAVRTLTFLLREYPGTPFRDSAEKDLARLQGVPVRKTSAVENIRYWEAPESVRVVIDVSGDVTFKQGNARSPNRVFLDIAPARLNSMLSGKQWPVNSSLLQQIRVAQFDATTVRVVFDVGAIQDVASFNLREPDRIVVDVLGTAATAPATAESGPEKSPKQSSVAQPAPQPIATAAVATPPPAPKVVESAPPLQSLVVPAKPTAEGTRSLIRSLGLKLSRVVIDAGHGGHDTGGIGPTGFTEKELVLDVAHRLQKLIETELGTDVVMTRTDDKFVSLESRTSVANQHGADLFISIHANSSRVRSVRGIETFFLNFTTSKEALETANRENAASEYTIHELEDITRKIMLAEKVEESRELARHIQKSMVGKKGANLDRGVKQAPFVVLIGASMPSILAEISFISNPQEEKQLKTAQYRQQIAEALFEGVKSYSESLSGLKSAKSQEKN